MMSTWWTKTFLCTLFNSHSFSIPPNLVASFPLVICVRFGSCSYAGVKRKKKWGINSKTRKRNWRISLGSNNNGKRSNFNNISSTFQVQLCFVKYLITHCRQQQLKLLFFSSFSLLHALRRVELPVLTPVWHHHRLFTKHSSTQVIATRFLFSFSLKIWWRLQTGCKSEVKSSGEHSWYS